MNGSLRRSSWPPEGPGRIFAGEEATRRRTVRRAHATSVGAARCAKGANGFGKRLWWMTTLLLLKFSEAGLQAMNFFLESHHFDFSPHGDVMKALEVGHL